MVRAAWAIAPQCRWCKQPAMAGGRQSAAGSSIRHVPYLDKLDAAPHLGGELVDHLALHLARPAPAAAE